MALHTYARITAGVVTNIESWDSASVPGGLVQIDTLNPVPGVTWTFAGGVFTPPVVDPNLINQATILTHVLTAQAQIQAFIAANPGGAVLTGPQTIVLAKMLNGLCLILLQQFSSTANT